MICINTWLSDDYSKYNPFFAIIIPKIHFANYHQIRSSPTMSSNKDDSRRAVTERIAEAGSNNVSAMHDAGRSSQRKRAENRAKREAEDPSKSDKKTGEAAAVRASLCTGLVRSYGLLTVSNRRKADKHTRCNDSLRSPRVQNTFSLLRSLSLHIIRRWGFMCVALFGCFWFSSPYLCVCCERSARCWIVSCFWRDFHSFDQLNCLLKKKKRKR